MYYRQWKTEVLEEKLIHHKSHMDWPGIEPGVLSPQANRLNIEA
jgi:hypothetical protein